MTILSRKPLSFDEVIKHQIIDDDGNKRHFVSLRIQASVDELMNCGDINNFIEENYADDSWFPSYTHINTPKVVGYTSGGDAVIEVVFVPELAD